jgi:hypothetical protein
MQKLIERMKADLEAQNFKKPTLHLSIKGNSKSEAYHLSYHSQTLFLNAEGERGALLGLSHLLFAKETWPNLLGKHDPKIEMRALWIEGDEMGFLSESVFCSYPKKLMEDPSFFWLYQLGFNRLIVGGKEGVSQNPFPKVSHPVILKPTLSHEVVSTSPLDENHKKRMAPFKNCLFESFSERASFLDHKESKNFTKNELLIKEAHLISPVYYLTESPTMELIDGLEKGVFCVVKKEAPLLFQVQKEVYPSETPLIGLMSLDQKSGLDLSFISEASRLNFKGLIVKVSSLEELSPQTALALSSKISLRCTP